MFNEFSSSITIFVLVLIVVVLLGATLAGVRLAVSAALTLLSAAARATGALLFVAAVVALLAFALLR